MKKFKRWILAFLLWELLVISQKDKTFKKQCVKKKGFEKVKFVIQSLFNFNKDMINESKESIQEMDLPTKVGEKIEQTKIWAENEYKHLQWKIEELEKNWKDLDKKYIQTTLAKLEKEYTPVYKKVVAISKGLDKKYDLQNKFVDIKKHITKLKRRKI